MFITFMCLAMYYDINFKTVGILNNTEMDNSLALYPSIIHNYINKSIALEKSN